MADVGQNGLIALAPAGRLGVDVEERNTRRDLDGIAQTVFALAEQAELAQARGDRKIHLFFSLWTMKEALIKVPRHRLFPEPVALRDPDAPAPRQTRRRIPVSPRPRHPLAAREPGQRQVRRHGLRIRAC